MVSGFFEYFDRVDIEWREDTLDCNEAGVFYVTPLWKGVDRPSTFSYVLPFDTAERFDLIVRLKACMESGAAFTGIEKCTDVNGKTYIFATMPILGRTMNADLKRLGY